VAGKVAQTGQPILRLRRFGHPVGQEGDTTSRPSPHNRHYRTDSFISVPLRVEETNTIIGVLNVTDRLDQQDLTQADLDMLLAIGGLIASAIENHRTWIRANEARQQLSEMVNGLPLGMFAISHEGLLTLCNRAARQYLNLGNGEGINSPWKRFFPQQTIPYIENALQELDSGRPRASNSRSKTQSSGKQRRAAFGLPIEELASVNTHTRHRHHRGSAPDAGTLRNCAAATDESTFFLSFLMNCGRLWPQSRVPFTCSNQWPLPRTETCRYLRHLYRKETSLALVNNISRPWTSKWCPAPVPKTHRMLAVSCAGRALRGGGQSRVSGP
jgi:PAS domain-containing protein